MTMILTIDDSSTIRSMVTKILKNTGYEVVQAADGQEALEVAKKIPIDIFISDINMPVMDGLEFVAQIKNVKHYRFTPIIILTTEYAEEKKDIAKQLGITGWITKPFTPGQLLNAIKKVSDY